MLARCLANHALSSSSPDRAGIVEVGAVEQLQENLIKALRSLITSRRPDDSTLFPKLLLRLPDLRTLNNHHSDKLLAFRIDPWAGGSRLSEVSACSPCEPGLPQSSGAASAWRTVAGTTASLILLAEAQQEVEAPELKPISPPAASRVTRIHNNVFCVLPHAFF